MIYNQCWYLKWAGESLFWLNEHLFMNFALISSCFFCVAAASNFIIFYWFVALNIILYESILCFIRKKGLIVYPFMLFCVGYLEHQSTLDLSYFLLFIMVLLFIARFIIVLAPHSRLLLVCVPQSFNLNILNHWVCWEYYAYFSVCNLAILLHLLVYWLVLTHGYSAT